MQDFALMKCIIKSRVTGVTKSIACVPSHTLSYHNPKEKCITWSKKFKKKNPTPSVIILSFPKLPDLLYIFK